MNVYRITRFHGDTPAYRDTLKAAQAKAKEGMERRQLGETRVDLIDVPTDKTGVIALLNMFSECGAVSYSALRTWKLSARGGLAEISRGE